jgi:hypothetical protein
MVLSLQYHALGRYHKEGPVGYMQSALSIFSMPHGRWLHVALFVGAFSFSVYANESEIRTSFHPYSQGGPRIPGLGPGVTLTATNAQVAREVLPDEILRLVIAGDLEILLQETTDLPPRQDYLSATITNADQATLNGGSTLHNYRSGTPFPLSGVGFLSCQTHLRSSSLCVILLRLRPRFRFKAAAREAALID